MSFTCACTPEPCTCGYVAATHEMQDRVARRLTMTNPTQPISDEQIDALINGPIYDSPAYGMPTIGTLKDALRQLRERVGYLERLIIKWKERARGKQALRERLALAEAVVEAVEDPFVAAGFEQIPGGFYDDGVQRLYDALAAYRAVQKKPEGGT